MREWNVTGILINILHEELDVSYAAMAREVNCSEETIRNWRDGKTKVQKGSIRSICKGIPAVLKKDEARQAYIDSIKREFGNSGDQVRTSMNKCESLEKLLEYLHTEFKNELGKDKLHSLINNPEEEKILREIVMNKFRINERHPQIYQVQEFGDAQRELLESKNMRWRFNLDHCFLLKFKGKEKKYDYEVLVNFNFNKEEFLNAGDYAEAREAAKAYGVKMILLFCNTDIQESQKLFLLDSNIYVEKIDVREIMERTNSKDYVYSSSSKDIEIEILANKYSDIVLGRFNKYFSVVFKNILFQSIDMNRMAAKKQDKKQDRYVCWDAKYAVRHHINFQTNRIQEYIKNGKISSGGAALAIGCFSFPSILRLAEEFSSIYLLDNSRVCIEEYERYLENYAPDLKGKVQFITFTSAMFDAISEKHKLYQAFDFILIGTGSGSFIKKLKAYYLMANTWLKWNGVIYISFLNSEFFYEYVDRITAEQNFEFIPIIGSSRASASFANMAEKYELYCETFSCNEMKDIAEKYYCVENMYSYPMSSVLEGTHKTSLQNILKEFDKEYSRKGFTVKTFSNSRGYYVDAVLRKRGVENRVKTTVPDNGALEKVSLDAIPDYKEQYLKTLLLKEKNSALGNDNQREEEACVYAVVLLSQKRLPENEKGEIVLDEKKFKLLSIGEINALGLEYRNISPFLVEQDLQMKLKRRYDSTIKLEGKQSVYYVGDGSPNGGFRVKGSALGEILKEQGYIGMKI